jgi:hypothetical protein
VVSADLLFRLDERARSFDDVHRNLRPEGDWSDGITGPANGEDWIQLEAYMGFFERIDAFIDDGQIDVAYVEEFSGYRYRNIVANRAIGVAKLTGDRRASWKRFVALGEKLERYRRETGKGRPR